MIFDYEAKETGDLLEWSCRQALEELLSNGAIREFRQPDDNEGTADFVISLPNGEEIELELKNHRERSYWLSSQSWTYSKKFKNGGYILFTGDVDIRNIAPFTKCGVVPVSIGRQIKTIDDMVKGIKKLSEVISKILKLYKRRECYSSIRELSSGVFVPHDSPYVSFSDSDPESTVTISPTGDIIHGETEETQPQNSEPSKEQTEEDTEEDQAIWLIPKEVHYCDMCYKLKPTLFYTKTKKFLCGDCQLEAILQ